VFSAIDAVGVITEQLIFAAIPPFCLLFITGCAALRGTLLAIKQQM